MWISNAVQNIFVPFAQTLGGLGSSTLLFTWDTFLTLLNVILPRRRQIPVWNEYIPPTPTDSRSPCPALNALCNHGVLPRDGKNISFKQIGDVVHSHYNFSPTFCKFVGQYIADALRKSYNDRIELSAIGTHNCIEHDGSLFREDIYFQPNQGTPAVDLIEDFFSTTKDGKGVTAADCSRALSHRFTQSALNNPHFSLQGIHLFFAASNASTIMTILGPDVETLRTILLEERIPEGWSSVDKTYFGLTMGRFNLTVLRVLLGINPYWKRVKYLA